VVFFYLSQRLLDSDNHTSSIPQVLLGKGADLSLLKYPLYQYPLFNQKEKSYVCFN